jgi:hypothetical protein
MTKTKLVMVSILAVAVFSIAAAPLTQDAFAAGSNGGAWGQATKSFTPLGEHSSSFDSPRTGLGNLKNSFGNNDWCDLLAFLGFGIFCI